MLIGFEDKIWLNLDEKGDYIIYSKHEYLYKTNKAPRNQLLYLAYTIAESFYKDILAYNNPYLDLLAAFGCFILFLVFSRRGHHWGKILGIVAVLEALVGVWILPDYAFITNLMPTSTILIFISVWSH